jgi:hypothetical protein
MKKLLTATCILLAGHAVHAGDTPAANAAPVVDTTSTQAPVYTPKNKSVFTGAMNAHNPFWPIGWVKTAEETSDTANVTPKADDFMVTTILLNDPPMAVINGKDMSEGEVATLPVQGQDVTVQLLSVQDGQVIIRWQNQHITVPIHRDEDDLTQATAPALQQ